MTLAEKINRLRTENGISREKLAEFLGVTTQSVQKWETGASKPDTEKLIRIAKRFNVSLDFLLLGSDSRVIKDVQSENLIKPDYVSLLKFEIYSKNLALEYIQSVDEGLDIEQYRDIFLSADKMPEGQAKEQIADVLFGIVSSAKVRADYPYREPSGLDEIRLCRGSHSFESKMPARALLETKIRGAWIGRIAGCLLGKTVECIHTDELVPFLKETGNYPMKRYIYKSDATDAICEKYRFPFKWRCYADDIQCAPSDDDTSYTVLAQIMVGMYGRDFNPDNVCATWLAMQPRNAYNTAERLAFRNMVNGYRPPMTAVYKNPYREWIGAQIRADYYGYINPGDPRTAAEMAWRDASVSHVKNGIYGGMFVAAALACAAVTNNTKDIILGGLAEIPQESRLYKYVNGVVEMYVKGKSAEETFSYIHGEFDEYAEHEWCHSIPNAMIVAASLLYGRGNYGRSVCLAVQTGFDTDCNGATVGSIVGLAYGSSYIGSEWSKPLKGKLKTSITGVEEISIDELVEKTMRDIPC